MKKNNYYKLSGLMLILCLTAFYQTIAQTPHSDEHERAVKFPDIPGYKTLKCDFHQHTVFSDGAVLPSIRVEEALKDGLDAIAITDHLEYQPHKEDIPHPDRNRVYQIALEASKDEDIMVINGVEITRDMLYSKLYSYSH